MGAPDRNRALAAGWFASVIIAAVARATSGFKQDHRINSLVLQYGTDAFAPNNRFGAAIKSPARPSIQTSIDDAVTDGSTSILLRMLALNDLTGTNEPSLVVGVINGVAVFKAGNPATYNGASDVDWWYTQNIAELDANSAPKLQLSGSIAANQLSIGPGSAQLSVNLGGVFVQMALSGARLDGITGTVSAPLTSPNGFPPGHLPSEMIPPSLQSFEMMGSGRLAGNIRAASLAAAQIPPGILANCTQYSIVNTWLDLLVGGCTAFSIPLVAPSQPDQVDPAAPPAGAGGPYVFTRTGASVTGCKDNSAAAVDLNTCLTAAAYSAYFQFTSDRVIVQDPPVPPAVGGVAEQPDVAALPAAAEPGAGHAGYLLGALVVMVGAAALGARWRRTRLRH